MGEIFGIPVLKLLQIFAVPITLGALVPLLNWLQKKRELVVENQRAQDQALLENRRAQDQALQAYLDQMSQLLANNEALKPGDRVGAIVRARTLSLLETLHAPLHQRFTLGVIVQFLYESDLITAKDGPIVRLTGANLKEAVLWERKLPSLSSLLAIPHDDSRSSDLGKGSWREKREKRCNEPLSIEPELSLSGVSLRRTRLDGAAFSSIDLGDADLSGANLTRANLTRATVTSEQLRTCKSLEGATMPNGQKYEDWLKDKENGKNE